MHAYPMVRAVDIAGDAPGDQGILVMKAQRRPKDAPGETDRPHVLIVEDEPDLLDLLRYNLERDGFVVTGVVSGEKALQIVQRQPPDLIVLDLMLPGIDGLEVCRRVRSSPETRDVPIVMLTARGEDADVVAGLELGADDYVTKPFSPRVLAARIKAVLRRGSGDDALDDTDAAPIEAGALSIRPDRHEVTIEGQPIDLTPTEFRLLSLLARRPGRVFTRQQIIEAIHGELAAVTDRSVDVQVVSLRRKMGELGEAVQTVRGVGYRYRD
jgi:two-component system phosphate regulon response regulator PhoB